MSTAEDIFREFKTTLISSVSIINKLFPDSLLFGSLILFVITHSLPYGVLSLFMLETSLAHRLISQLITSFVGITTSTQSISSSLACVPGFVGQASAMKFSTASMYLANKYSHLTFPSYPIFIMVSVAVYFAMASNYFKDTMDEIGQNWSSRYIVSWIFCGLVPFIYIIIRLITGCASDFADIITAVMLGGLVGFLLFMLNKHIFGPESMNFLGLPYLIDKTKTDNPIYICEGGKPPSRSL